MPCSLASNPPAKQTVRDAATVALLREGERGPEVLLLRRHHGHVFGPGAEVFPGGAVDDADYDAALAARCSGAADHHDPLRVYRMAAIRECFEEAGVLVACKAAKRFDAAELDALRERLNGRCIDWLDVVAALDLRFSPDALLSLGVWTTPAGAPRRYAARFFATRAALGGIAHADGHETVAAAWQRPADVLAAFAAGRTCLMTPTRITLEAMTGHADLDALMAMLARYAETVS